MNKTIKSPLIRNATVSFLLGIIISFACASYAEASALKQSEIAFKRDLKISVLNANAPLFSHRYTQYEGQTRRGLSFCTLVDVADNVLTSPDPGVTKILDLAEQYLKEGHYASSYFGAGLALSILMTKAGTGRIEGDAAKARDKAISLMKRAADNLDKNVYIDNRKPLILGNKRDD